ncbi:MAG TPA: vanadium-dependent haloperoxidase [Burkholderiales bacterium]|nr:vanadium-dependent haloperoxidase [Burkholderiales bacterium]
MKAANRIFSTTALFAAMSSVAMADVITDWNETAVAAGYKAGVSPDLHSRNMAIVHISMFEAVNTIEPRYTPYRNRLPVERGTSRDAAAAAAAHHALSRLFPEQAKDFDKALQASLGAVAEGPGKAGGVRLGEQAAAAMLAERSKDGTQAPISYRPYTTPGRYVPTPFPASSIWGGVLPFGMKSGDAFRPPAPYALTSAEWARDYNEIKRLGAKSGSARTPEQTDIARFWALTGPATYNPVARQISAAKGLDVIDNARLFALVAIATADAAIAVFDAKYTYNFWRPVTAIRNGDIDGNDATERDGAWESFIPTPMHPEYPCAHCIFQGSAAAVTQVLFGDSVPKFTLTSTAAPGVTRSFDRLSDYVAEVINARVYDGVHYRTSGEVGAAMGRRIGEHTVQNYFKPLH